MNNIRHKYTNNITCPYCGYEYIDSWEMQSGEEDIGLIQCDNCYKHFYANRNIAIDYSTKKAKYGTCGHCGKEMVVEDFRSFIGSYEGLCPDCGYKEERRLVKEYWDIVSEKIVLDMKGY